MKSKPAKQMRGFAVMKPADVHRIAKMGGKAVSRDSAHMAEIGSRGGTTTGRMLQKAFRKIAKMEQKGTKC